MNLSLMRRFPQQWMLLMLAACAAPAVATPVFSFTFSPTVIVANPGGTFEVVAEITNEGSSSIIGLQGAEIYGPDAPGYLSPEVASYMEGAPGDSAEQQFAGIDLAPQQTFSFTLATFTLLADTAPGAYTAFDDTQTWIDLSDNLGQDAKVYASNNVTVDVVAGAPEPGSWALLLVAGGLLVGKYACVLAGLRARRPS